MYDVDCYVEHKMIIKLLILFFFFFRKKKEGKGIKEACRSGNSNGRRDANSKN